MTPRKVRRPGALGYSRGRGARLLTIAAPTLLVGLWIAISAFELVRPLYLPPPWRVLQAAADIRPGLHVHAFHTVALALAGLLIGAGSGIACGLAMRHWVAVRYLLTPIVDSWRPVPPVAVVPFFILWFGFAWTGKLVLVSLGVFFILVVAVTDAIDHLDPKYLRSTLSFGGDNASFLRHAALFAILPGLLPPLRIALATALTMTVIAEFMGSTQGLGYLINLSLSTFSSHTILLCSITLGVLGGVLDLLLRRAHAALISWASITRAGPSLDFTSGGRK